MIRVKTVLLFMLSVLIQACGQKQSHIKQEAYSKPTEQLIIAQEINPEGSSIFSRFNVPKAYRRIIVPDTSFANHLRSLSLKPHGSLVTYYDGKSKLNNHVYDAVVDLPIGKRDLHQCADAVIRLRADYFYQNKLFDSIHFNFTNGFTAEYSNWRKGKRIVVNGNNVSWKQTTQSSDVSKEYWKYLEMVFSYAGTASLSKELKSVPLEKIQIGDVFIQGGFPGHVVIVVDMAVHETTKEKIFLLAQSYMPAQEIQILKNPDYSDMSPWYSTKIGSELRTPEWSFKKTDLKRFVD